MKGFAACANSFDRERIVTAEEGGYGAKGVVYRVRYVATLLRSRLAIGVSSVVILDPNKAKRGREVRVAAEAEIANLPKWVDREEAAAFKREHDD
ncbi:MAG: hypothetical protein V1929_09200 [bacterium]